MTEPSYYMKALDKMLKQRLGMYNSLTAAAAALITHTVIPTFAIEMNTTPDTMVCSEVSGYGKLYYKLTIDLITTFGEITSNKYLAYAVQVTGVDMSEYDDEYETVNCSISIVVPRVLLDMDEVQMTLAIKDLVHENFTDASKTDATEPVTPPEVTQEQQQMADIMLLYYGRTIQ